MYAMHSIFYNNLPSYFLGFSIWNDKNNCLHWDETIQWFQILGITPVREIYRGIFDDELIRSLTHANGSVIMDKNMEGYVCRTVK